MFRVLLCVILGQLLHMHSFPIAVLSYNDDIIDSSLIHHFCHQHRFHTVYPNDLHMIDYVKCFITNDDEAPVMLYHCR